MRSILLLPLALSLAAAAQGDRDEDGTLRCITESSGLAINESVIMARAPKYPRQPINIDLYMHFVGPDDKSPEDQLRKIAEKQLDVLNTAFRDSDISFTMQDVLFWNDAFYAGIQDGGELASMIQKYRRGDTKTLNLFVPKFPSKSLGIGGCISIDDLFMLQTTPLSSDGCFVDSTTLPGSISKRYNQGKTAVHEVGHWLGLLHTFDGGCDGDGDHIRDTPAQAYATYRCDDEFQDTCPAKDGYDPIHNYMGYSYDSCMTEFTKGQTFIMHYTWNRFRK
ncbi:hypothetical protein BB8028_0002g16720 [Beauveria bassiana]|uniref:Peptidase M43 pregnancy-associated plasma-A domain-containing protein n=1 Tax=Beauveria bassiana TaxID=176275 RepID=A0A2S7Y5N9_BEABA|nr:hypothetical protein BB8028_0002g16720 [Beauveria bassiana]